MVHILQKLKTLIFRNCKSPWKPLNSIRVGVHEMLLQLGKDTSPDYLNSIAQFCF